MSTLPALGLAALISLLFVSVLNIHSPVLRAVVSTFLNDSSQKNTTYGGDDESNATGTSFATPNKVGVANSFNKSNETLDIGSQILALQERELAQYRVEAVADTTMNASDIVGVANAHNRTAIPCHGKRIAIIGSSHGRSLAFSFAGALTGMAYAKEGEERHVPLFNFNYSAIPERKACNSMEVRKSNGKDPVDSCDMPEYKPFFENRRICRYTYDAGVDVGNCGYPGMKRWALGPGRYYSEPSVPINYPLPYAPDEPHLAQLYFLFKTWIHSPKVDEHSMRNLEAFRPDVLILDFSMWGCRTPDKLKTGRTDWPEDKARNCTHDFIQTVAHWDRTFGGDNFPYIMIHYVNPATQPVEEFNANLAAVKRLQQSSQTKVRHVLLDKKDVVMAVDSSILGHGFLGKATDIWARTALEVICPANNSYIDRTTREDKH